MYQGLLWAARARARLAVGLQIQDHLADDLADHLSLFWLNKHCKFDGVRPATWISSSMLLYMMKFNGMSTVPWHPPC